MKRKLSARQLELDAVSAEPSKPPAAKVCDGEAMAMLARRGLQPEKTPADVPFPPELKSVLADRFSDWLGHYAFRLFLRGAIRKSRGFRPEETTRYLTREQAAVYADALVSLGLAEKLPPRRYRLKWPARNFGGTLEWYVARELARRYGFDVATGIKLHVGGVGGDLDVVAAAEGKLVYIELKSSPPRNLTSGEMTGFFDRLTLLRPDLSLFVVDTALRLSDKVLPMLMDEFRRRDFEAAKPKRIAVQLWALTPHIYVVNGRRDLMANIGKALASGLLALSPCRLEP
jgi:hypothetical protein